MKIKYEPILQGRLNYEISIRPLKVNEILRLDLFTLNKACDRMKQRRLASA
jgi:hypothetical protein